MESVRIERLKRIDLRGRLGAVRSARIGPIALGVLLGGLAVAIAFDGSLPLIWSRILFGALFVANLIVADWLIR